MHLALQGLETLYDLTDHCGEVILEMDWLITGKLPVFDSDQGLTANRCLEVTIAGYLTTIASYLTAIASYLLRLQVIYYGRDHGYQH